MAALSKRELDLIGSANLTIVSKEEREQIADESEAQNESVCSDALLKSEYDPSWQRAQDADVDDCICQHEDATRSHMLHRGASKVFELHIAANGPDLFLRLPLPGSASPWFAPPPPCLRPF